MSKKPFCIPASDQERNSAIKQLTIDNDLIGFIEADVALGIACQDLCRSRDDLADFALKKGLAPYLKAFLQRRGWIDDDWRNRLETVRDVFQQQVN